MATYNELLQNGKNILKDHGIADADVDAWYLLSHVFDFNRTTYLLQKDTQVGKEKAAEYERLTHQRASHIPLQQITNNQEFMGLSFYVNEHVLIPRQDTECLVEEVLQISEGKTILDMCTGSGCIILSLYKLGNISQGVGVDISEDALAVARKNARNLCANVDFIQSDLFDQVTGQYDIIVSNPPYISMADMKDLMPEVRIHEPTLALLGGEDGLTFYRRIIDTLPKHLKVGGNVFFEIGYNQGNDVANLLSKAGFIEIEIKKDLCGLDRIVCGRYAPT